jgi:NADH:ubiquinone oxidoreductase subunit F (NADH-binding)
MTEKYYVLVSPGEGSSPEELKEVTKRMEEEVTSRGLSGKVKVLEVKNVGFEGQGVLMGVYPGPVCYEDVKPDTCLQIVEEHLLGGKPAKELVRLTEGAPNLRQTRVVLENVGAIDPERIDDYLKMGGYSALKKALAMPPQEVIEEVKKSGLRGRGGAGFPAGIKWESARKTPEPEKFIICNADEGEPGTFKDRPLMEGDPHKLIEGITIAGYAVGAKKGYIYIRGEYALSIQRVSKAIQDARKRGFLGEGILGTNFSFDIEVKEGAGSYVCGDETALMESLEGKRGNPRIKPPYPTVVGLFGKPTVINNVETLANVPSILARGGEWFRTLGTPRSPGTKIYLVIGDVNSPGFVELEMGTTLAEIVFVYGGGIKGGKGFKAALVGGAAGVFIPERLLSMKLDFDSPKEFGAVLGSGSVLVLSEYSSIADILLSVLKFFQHESCGQCSPCRSGTRELVRIMTRMMEKEGSSEDLDTMVKLSQVLWYTSLCPLGQSLIMPVKSAVDNFREELLSLGQ